MHSGCTLAAATLHSFVIGEPGSIAHYSWLSRASRIFIAPRQTKRVIDKAIARDKPNRIKSLSK